MKHLFFPLIALVAIPAALQAGIDPKVHNLCKEVRDYVGCVKSNKLKEKSIFENLSKKEKQFLDEFLNSERYVSSKEGNWIELKLSDRDDPNIIKLNTISFVNTKSIKKIGKLAFIKRCIKYKDGVNKNICDTKGNGLLTANKSLPRSITGGQLFDCKRKLYLSRKSSFSSYSKDEWKSIDPIKNRGNDYHIKTWEVACNYKNPFKIF